MAHDASVEVNGSSMRICIAAPDGAAPRPLVVVMCHIEGLDAFTEDRVDRLATAGFVAVAPDVFHYHEWIDEREARRATLRDLRIVDDIRASIAHAKDSQSVAPGPLAMIGHWRFSPRR